MHSIPLGTIKKYVFETKMQSWTKVFTETHFKHQHTCDSTAGSRKIPFLKPVCRSTVPVDQTTVFENFRKYFENPIKSVPISLFRHAPV